MEETEIIETQSTGATETKKPGKSRGKAVRRVLIGMVAVILSLVLLIVSGV